MRWTRMTMHINVDKDDEVDKDEKVDKEEEEDMNKKEEEEDEFFFAKILKMIKYTSLPNLVRLGQWEQVSEYYYILQPKIDRGDQIAFATYYMLSPLQPLQRHDCKPTRNKTVSEYDSKL